MRVFALAALLAVLAWSAPADVTVLFFTASWCEPCRAVDAVLEKASRDYGDRVKLIVVDFDTAVELNQRWDVHDIPVVIVLGRDGKAALRAQGASRETLRALRSGLDDLLKPARKGDKP